MELIPGFNRPDADVESNLPITITIPENHEWRFEVPFKLSLSLKILDGIAEIFGTELPINTDLSFSGVKYSVYAPLPQGCKLQYTLKINKEQSNTTNEPASISEYISSDTLSMKQVVNLHFYLEKKRQEATDRNLVNQHSVNQTPAPKVLLLGPKFSGKSTVAKILCSYGFKMDRCPILVNLNPRDGVFAMPGALTATPISDNFDLEAVGGYGGSTTSGTTYHNPKQPLVKNYGFEDFAANLDLYRHHISKLGVATMSRLEEDIAVKNSGVIIDTPALTIKDIRLIEDIVSDFEVDHIVVIGNEKLSIDLQKKFVHKVSNNSLCIIKLSKSEGVVELDESYIRKCQEETIKQYFNGYFRNPLSPFKTEITISDFVFYQPVDSSEFNSSLLFAPSGDSFAPDATEETEKKEDTLDKYYKKIDDFSANNLENLVLAVTQLPATNKSPNDLLDACILGYVHVSKYEESKGRLKVLLPVPGAFPRNILIATKIGYTE